MAKSPPFKLGDHVHHPASQPGATPSFPVGTGVITHVNTSTTPPTYRVKCDVTGQDLSPAFKESDLSAA